MTGARCIFIMPTISIQSSVCTYYPKKLGCFGVPSIRKSNGNWPKQ